MNIMPIIEFINESNNKKFLIGDHESVNHHLFL